MWARQRPPGLQQQPAVDHRRRVDARDDGLRQVLQRTGRRRALRRDAHWVLPRRQLHGADRVRCDVQCELQGVFEADVGGAGDIVREGERVGHVDVEDGAGGRVVLYGRAEVRLDPYGPYLAPIPEHLWLRSVVRERRI